MFLATRHCYWSRKPSTEVIAFDWYSLIPLVSFDWLDTLMAFSIPSKECSKLFFRFWTFLRKPSFKVVLRFGLSCRQNAQKLVKFVHAVLELGYASGETERQTDRQTDVLIAVLCCHLPEWSNNQQEEVAYVLAISTIFTSLHFTVDDHGRLIEWILMYKRYFKIVNRYAVGTPVKNDKVHSLHFDYVGVK